MVKSINTELTPRQQAEKELRAESQKENIAKFKKKLKELEAAKKIVRNLEREIQDLEDEIDDES